MTSEACRRRRRHEGGVEASITMWASVLVGALLLVAAAAPAVAESAEPVVLTSGVVRAIDRVTGVVTLDSGWKVQVRRVILKDRVLLDLAEIRIGDEIFVSGAVIERPADARSAVSRVKP